MWEHFNGVECANDSDLLLVPFRCHQKKKNIYKTEYASICHGVSLPSKISLLRQRREEREKKTWYITLFLMLCNFNSTTKSLNGYRENVEENEKKLPKTYKRKKVEWIEGEKKNRIGRKPDLSQLLSELLLLRTTCLFYVYAKDFNHWSNSKVERANIFGVIL